MGSVPLFPKLKIVIEVLFILPFPNASGERVFSFLKNINVNEINWKQKQ